MKSIRKEQNQGSIQEEIKQLAWQQITASGVYSLSLGEIARSMHLTTPALYRYFSSRDELISALTREAYSSFLKMLEKARDSQARENHANQFRAICMEYYHWAKEFPSQYQVIFNTPFSKKYDESVGEIADQGFLVVVELFDQAFKIGSIKTNPGAPISKELRAQLEKPSKQNKVFPAEVMILALETWSFFNGITILDLNQKYSLILADQTLDFYQLEVSRLMQTIGFK